MHAPLSPAIVAVASSGPRTKAMSRRVLILEDEMLVAMLLEDILMDLGHSVAATAGSIRQALDAIEKMPVDLAILDVNLPDGRSDAVADALLVRKIPFVFATGYGAQGVAEDYRQAPVIQKPYDEHGLRHAIETAILAG